MFSYIDYRIIILLELRRFLSPDGLPHVTERFFPDLIIAMLALLPFIGHPKAIYHEKLLLYYFI